MLSSTLPISVGSFDFFLKHNCLCITYNAKGIRQQIELRAAEILETL